MFADDTTACEAGPDAGVRDRCTAIRNESLENGLGQAMSVTKFAGLAVRPPVEVSPTTAEDVRALNLKFECVCSETWETKHGLLRHQAACKRAQETFEADDEGDVNHDVEVWVSCTYTISLVEALLAVRGPPERRYWRVNQVGGSES